MKNLITYILVFSCLSFGGSVMADNGPESQIVVMHSKGESFPAGGISFDDPRIQQHGKYWASSGVVEKGGPMPGTGGGMMLLKLGTTMEMAQKIANEDPAVKIKLLKADVRQWLLVIDNARAPAMKK